MATFMLSISDESLEKLANEAKHRGINVQTLIRAVVIPEWTSMSLDNKISTISKTLDTSIDNDDTKVDAAVLPQITVAKRGWREVDTYRSLYFRNIRR